MMNNNFSKTDIFSKDYQHSQLNLKNNIQTQLVRQNFTQRTFVCTGAIL